MLEVLYATGLRVSELINLKQSEINLNQGVLRIVGKGDRERLIPLGEEAQNWIREFIAGPRSYLPGTKMTYAGISDMTERAELVAWLRTLSADPVPLPAAGWMLIAGVGGLAAAGRRKKA